MFKTQSNNQNLNCGLPVNTSEVIRLGHGSGGKMSASLIENVFLPKLGNEILNQLDDAAIVDMNNSFLAFTADSYVVSPIFFPGGNIGSLSVHGTVNDLAMRGAKPLYMMATFILEEGLPVNELSTVVDSMKNACLEANIQLIAADTKVVNRGAADKLFITTAGVGIVECQSVPGPKKILPGDYILLNGDVGRHGMAIMATREGLELDTEITSDSTLLHNIVQKMLCIPDAIHCMRDITRGGLSSVLNELAQCSNVGMMLDEEMIPVHPQVEAICELLGLDPLYVACEGRFVTIASPQTVNELLAIMKQQPTGENSCVIGQVVKDHPGRVVLKSKIGGHRIIDKLSGEQLPRIC